MGRSRRKGRGRDGAGLRRYLVWYALIGFCAFFCAAGIQMMEGDVGAVQMETFQPQDSKFRRCCVPQEVAEELEVMQEISSVKCEKLLAAVMLKQQWEPRAGLRKAEVFADMLGYERADPERFQEIASYYKRIGEAVEYLPFADLFSQDGKTLLFAAESCLQQLVEREDFGLELLLDERWKKLVPVVCMKESEVISCQENGELLLEQADGIRVYYQNLTDYWQTWQVGDKLMGGEFLGSCEKLQLQFEVQLEDGSWLTFCGRFSLQNNEKAVRSLVLAD